MKAARSFVATALVAVSFANCNDLLDNTPGFLATEGDGGVAEDAATQAPDAEHGVDAAQPPICAAGELACGAVCASPNDPAFGCGNPSCTPCSLAHATATCRAGACAIASCQAGYADCNARANDGCEMDLSQPTSCGSCNVACPAAAPLCAPAGSGFLCTNGCAPAAPLLCANACVDPMSSDTNCGACGVRCPAVTNASSACVRGACSFTCRNTFHACGGRCVADTDPTACGPTCAACAVPQNGRAACHDNACAFTCDRGFADCDHVAANGCEANLAMDPANCGACGAGCDGGTCVAGICVPIPLRDAGHDADAAGPAGPPGQPVP